MCKARFTRGHGGVAWIVWISAGFRPAGQTLRRQTKDHRVLQTSSQHFEDQAFEVVGLGNRQQNWVVLGLRPPLQDSQRAVGVQ